MKAPESDSAGRSLADLIRRARADAPPAVDLVALLAAVRREPLNAAAPLTPSPWWSEFFSLFETRIASWGCGLGAAACSGFVVWQAWSVWEEVVPWAQLAGGVDLSFIGGGL